MPSGNWLVFAKNNACALSAASRIKAQNDCASKVMLLVNLPVDTMILGLYNRFQLVPVSNGLAANENRAHTFSAAQEKPYRASGSSCCKPFDPERLFLPCTTRLCGVNNPLHQNRYRRLAAQVTCEDKRLPVVKRKTNCIERSSETVPERESGFDVREGIGHLLPPNVRAKSEPSHRRPDDLLCSVQRFSFFLKSSFPRSAKEGELRGWFSSSVLVSFYIHSGPKRQRAIPPKQDPAQLRLMEEPETYGTKLCSTCKTNPVYMPWIKTMTECESCLWKLLQEEN